ncbi:ATP-dependent permease [Pseudogymnoascus australis]
MEWYDLRKDGISPVLIRIQTQVRELQMATSQPLGFFVKDIAAVIMAIGIAFYYSWKLTLVLSLSVPITSLVLWLVSRRLQPAIEAQRRALNIASKYTNTAFHAIDTVKVFNGQNHEVRQYASAINAAGLSYLIQGHVRASQMGTVRFLVVVMFMAGFWYGLMLFRNGELTPGDVITTFYSFLMGNQAVTSLLAQYVILCKGKSAGATLERIVGELNNTLPLSKIAGTRTLEVCDGDIEVTNLKFSYPSNPSQSALIGVDLFFPAGETTFLFGRSGSGKSTLTNLLLRLYDITSGTISIDGCPIETLDVNWLRNNVTLVQQQSVLFNDTLWNNVAFGCGDRKQPIEEDIRVACEMAMLTEVIQELPNGLNTLIGTGGDSMSGGQKQRVAIARARLRDTPILILDEATNALDHVNKTLVMDAIREWRKDKTTIIITHDSSQIQDMDFVYVIDHGKVVEEGYRHSLAQNSIGLFASLAEVKSDKKYMEEKLGQVLSSHQNRGSAQPHGNTAMFNNARVTSAYPYANDPFREGISENLEPMTKLQRFSAFMAYNPGSSQQDHHQNQRTSLSMATVLAKTIPTDNTPDNRISWPLRSQEPLPNSPEPSYKRSHHRLSRYPPKNFSYNGLAAHNQEEMVNQAKTIEGDGLKARNADSDLNMEYINLVRGSSVHVSAEKNKMDSRQAGPASLKAIMGTVWPSITRRERLVLILGFFSAFIYAACTPVFSYVLAKLYNTFYETHNQEAESRKWALTLLLIAVVDGSSSYTFYYSLDRCAKAWVDSLREEALTRILDQPRSWFDEAENSPSILNESLDRTGEEMRNLLGRFAGYTFTAACMIIIGVIWAFIMCWKLTAVSLANVPIIYAITRAFEAVSGNLERKSDAKSSAIGEVFAETFSNIRVVRALTLESHFQRKNSGAVQEAFRIGLRRGTFCGLFYGLSQSTTIFLTALILFYGTILVGTGAARFSDVVTCITLLLFSIGNANETLSVIPQIATARAGATGMLRLASLPPGKSAWLLHQRTLPSPLPIRMANLSFAYPSQPHNPILQNLSLTLDAGTCTALVGPSGSGKTTLASLLLGLYTPSSNSSTLTFARHPLANLALPDLRAHMALVPQFPTLFPASLMQNILYGLAPSSPLTCLANIGRAISAAGLTDFVARLPEGLETLIGEGGRALSGGETVRVAIARALVRKPRVLVMDEPTAGLDAEGVERIGAVLEGLEGGVAVVLVTHDVRMMRRAGWVVVVEGGRAVEQGRWEDLRWAGGAMERLVGGGELGEVKD